MQTTNKPYIDFAAIKAAVSITQVLERYGLMANLRPSGTDALRGACPIHGGSDPKQFSVSISKGCWHCFANECNRGGNILDLVAGLEETDVHQAALLVNEWFALGLEAPGRKHTHGSPARVGIPKAKPVPKPAPAPERASDFEDDPDADDVGDNHPADETVEREPARSAARRARPSAQAPRPLSAPVANKPLQFELKDLDPDHPYLLERGLQPHTVEYFGLGFCRTGTMSGRIAIPIHNAEGELVGYAGRWPGDPPEGRPKYKLPKGFGKSVEVFNLHRLDDNEDLYPLIIVEGFFDCIWLWQHGYRHCVALMGSSLSDAQEAAIARVLARTEAPLVELLFDGDEAGRKGADETLKRLAPYAYVRKVSLGTDGRHPDDLSMDELDRLLG